MGENFLSWADREPNGTDEVIRELFQSLHRYPNLFPMVAALVVRPISQRPNPSVIAKFLKVDATGSCEMAVILSRFFSGADEVVDRRRAALVPYLIYRLGPFCIRPKGGQIRKYVEVWCKELGKLKADVAFVQQSPSQIEIWECKVNLHSWSRDLDGRVEEKVLFLKKLQARCGQVGRSIVGFATLAEVQDEASDMGLPVMDRGEIGKRLSA